MGMWVLLHPTDELTVASSWQNVMDDKEHCPKNVIDMWEYETNMVIKVGVEQQIWN